MNKYTLLEQELSALMISGGINKQIDTCSMIVEYELDIAWDFDGVTVNSDNEEFCDEYWFCDHNSSKSNCLRYAVVSTVINMLKKNK